MVEGGREGEREGGREKGGGRKGRDGETQIVKHDFISLEFGLSL